MRTLLLCLACVLGFQSMAMADQTEAQAADAKNAVKASNEFAFDLYKRSSDVAGNLFFSPSSIHTALSMAAAGAKGDTEKQFAAALHFSKGTRQSMESIHTLLESINQSAVFGDNKAYDLVTANALWAQNDYPFQPAYVSSIKGSFGASLENMDFAAAPDPSRQKINQWVEKQTKDKIKDLLPQGSIIPATRLVLTNAIYFKAAWADQFNKHGTQPLPFHKSATEAVDTDMMRQVDRFGYFENEKLQAIELPYTANALSMVIILPKQINGIAAIEREMTASGFAEILGGLETRKTELTLPKFKFQTSMTLNDTLMAMGIQDAFALDKADFSGMTTAEKFAISIVLHKAFIDVNEDGTEAAAATALVMVGSAMPKPEEPVVFKADHPFLFVIRHNQTGAILFMGRLVDPK